MTDYRTKCLSHKPEQCLICGTEENIDVHHKDGDPQNNSLENLVPLCEKHHTGVHKGESPNTELNESAQRSNGSADWTHRTIRDDVLVQRALGRGKVRDLSTRDGFRVRLPADECRNKGMELGEPVIVTQPGDEIEEYTPEPDFKIYRVYQGVDES